MKWNYLTAHKEEEEMMKKKKNKKKNEQVSSGVSVSQSPY